ncbi:MAG: replication initiator protein A [Proteobacteria bacterium]|nr:replication initiator protein A [Pseudomonadota bacterium]MBU1649875.1 replication initiator protein A [Pseudomonadota bacterium]
MKINPEQNGAYSECEEETAILNTKVNKQIDNMQRMAFLNSKGINPNNNFQLDLIFPETIGKRSDLRHIPNDYARSSLFTATNKSQPRKTLLREKLFHYNEFVSILYTGIELRAEDDEIVWLQILNYGKGVPLGKPFEFSVRDLVRDVNWSKSGRNYDRVRNCISRLRANEVLALNTKAYGKSGSISLIGNYEAVNNEEGKPTHYRIFIDPNLIMLFAGSAFTCHTWEIYRNLSPVARRLADYIESHKHPFPLSLETFRKMCGSKDSSTRSWRQTVKKACIEVHKIKIAATAILTKEDKICCVRHKDRNG